MSLWADHHSALIAMKGIVLLALLGAVAAMELPAPKVRHNADGLEISIDGKFSDWSVLGNVYSVAISNSVNKPF